MVNQTESRLLYEILKTLGLHGAVFRTNAGQFFDKSGRRVSGLPKGFSDIMLILPGGQACFIECKTKPNKPTDEQVEFIEKMRRLGCRAGVAFSIDDALRICGLTDNAASTVAQGQ